MENVRRGLSILLGLSGGLVLNILPLESSVLKWLLLLLLLAGLLLRLVTEVCRRVSYQIPYVLTLGGFLLWQYGTSLEASLLAATIVATLSGVLGLLLLDREPAAAD